ncbi:MAG TPA: hypothetical protein VGL65_11380 [Gemmatimonadales bacterium]|jgi:hypothetical protein
MMHDFMKFCSDQPLDALLNPHRAEEQDRARAAGAARLQALGVRLTGTETSDDVGDLLDAIEEFEQAVESRGGDLMVDEGPHGVTTEPEEPDFVLPRRADREAVAAYAARLVAAASRLRHGGGNP